MSIGSKVLGFLFGKSADIFDEKGRVRHKLGNEKWQDWQSRYTSDPEYNWRNHRGMRAKDRTKN